MKLSPPYLESISAEHGPTFYLLDAPRFIENFGSLISEFRKYYQKTSIAYSYKTNYIPRFCSIVEDLGGYAEVVSSMELTLARKVGVPDEKIFFNGPYKEPDQVASLLSGGGTVNIDSMVELLRISSFADGYSGPALKLGLRCNFNVFDDVVSRFGFDVDGEEFLNAIRLIESHKNLNLVGLHCHFASRSLSCWENRTKGMLDVIERHFRDKVETLRHVSLGGGIFSAMPDALKAQFPVQIPTFAEYAKAAALPFARYFDKLGVRHRPMLIIEPGTALAADSLKFVCSVNSIKKVQGRTVVSLSGSTYNINPTPNRKNVAITIYSSLNDDAKYQVEDAYFGGYTCIESDYLYKGFSGRIAVGDFVVFDDVGSYSVVMKPPFILPNVAVLEPDGTAQGYSLVKRRETFEDIFRTYILT